MFNCLSWLEERIERVFHRPRPIFNVRVIQPDTTYSNLLAGEKQAICKIVISFPENYSRRSEPLPTPSFYSSYFSSASQDSLEKIKTVHIQDVIRRYFHYEVQNQNQNQMEIIVFANKTLSGFYRVYPHFPETAQVTFIGKEYVEFVVQPSKPELLKVLKMNSMSGDRLNLYKGGKAEVFVQVKDEFCNTIKDVELAVESSSYVTPESCRFDSNRGCHVVIVACTKEGKATLSFTTASLQADIERTIVPAPLCPFNCQVSRTKEGSVILAGQIVTWILELRDIFNHPYHLEDQSLSAIAMTIDYDNVQVYDQATRQTEKQSLKFFIVRNSRLMLEWKPLIAGMRSLTLSINGLEIDQRRRLFCVNVEPSRVACLTVLKMIPLSGDRLDFYRGGKAEVNVKVKDSYCNTIEDIEIGVKSSHVTLESCYFDSNRGCHVVIVDCNKEGKAILSFTTASLRADIERTIVPAPLCPSNCQLSRTEEGSVLAGQIVTWSLQLRDIFNRVFQVKDDGSSLLAIVTAKIYDNLAEHEKSLYRRKEERLFSIMYSHDNHICRVEWKPLVAGKRCISFLINGTLIARRRINVEPGPLAKLAVKRFKNSFICYPTDEIAVTLRGYDIYNNSIFPLTPRQWLLDSSGEGLKQRVSLSEDTKKLMYYLSFDQPGKFLLQVKPNDNALKNVQVPEPFSVDIVSPFDIERCIVRIKEEQPIFQNSLKIWVSLSLCTGVTNRCLEHVLRFLEMKVDDQSVVIPRCRPESYHSWDIPLCNLQYGQGKTFELSYCGKRLGKKLQIDLDGVRQFQTTDYIEKLNSSKKIRCKGVPLGILIGADHANINNINRVLAIDGTSSLLEGQIKKDEQRVGNVVDFNLDGFDDKSVHVVYKLLDFLVKGFHHYRKQAHGFGVKRRKWKEKEKQAKHNEIEAKKNGSYQRQNIDESSKCKEVKEEYGRFMDECHEKASNAIFEFYNFKRDEGEIDLHGQQVANEQNLQNLRMELSTGVQTRDENIEHIIQSIRERNDEAIRHLRKRLNNFDHEKAKLEERDWLEIIVGAGHHSDNKRQKIRPKVEEFLKSMKYKFIECNPGSLLITFTEYSGEEPCVANFLCQKCRRSWESRTSWIGMFQKCYSCDRKGIVSKCYPFKLRSLSTSTSTSYQRKTDFKRNDHRRLCQKCIELGRDCSI